MIIISYEDFINKELEIKELEIPKIIFITNQSCNLEDLTSEELIIYRFMEHSKRINGSVIVPPWMLEKAKEVEKKLGFSL